MVQRSIPIKQHTNCGSKNGIIVSLYIKPTNIGKQNKIDIPINTFPI